ncbi:hypothetical protein EHQ16_10800 [Leptospira kanakyensis]|uniref:Lipoprotein n=1 Tax=Leptospira kanakyensis TaxID=2484968 RepID=A0A6N4PWQ3_9LEPT|nr:hypothetical protein [Leptospira kanakyensis]TGK49226.1 hypothetical protein EHQ11_14390 [Leptospira kanakyensis]TGK60533.1 hypothetical protein EHQ16_10800 [Leptospira kanakyensis]TGK67933.1 hypothetical protein EHQ18_15600 [Leptospira kanakyensis]
MKKLALAGILFSMVAFANCTQYRVIDSANVDGKLYVTVIKAPFFGGAEGYVAKCDADASGNLKCKQVRLNVTN